MRLENVILMIFCCLLLLQITDSDGKAETISSTSTHPISIPALPYDHLLCWLRNLSDDIRRRLAECCTGGGHNCSAITIPDWDIKGASEFVLKERICRLIQLKGAQHDSPPCWGYERDAHRDCLLYPPECPREAPSSWAPNKAEQWKNFFNTADFGYVSERQRELEYYCEPKSPEASELKCTNLLRYCTGKNVFINLRTMPHIQESIRYREDVLKPGDIGGWDCALDRDKLINESDHKSPLMSWAAEMLNFRVKSDGEDGQCDVTLTKPTFVMKLDATINMYHHFCDFINLYISMHVNGTHFDMDNHILIWDNYPYRSNFAPTWRAFTRNPILSLADFVGKRICLKNVMFPLLPRMIYGLYYNMPLIPGCDQSGIFRAFNRHLLFHLGQKQSDLKEMQLNDHIRVTFIERNTQFRRVLNQKELIEAARSQLKDSKVKIEVVDFNHRMPFLEQVAISARSDILIGMHGAGLSHTLLQPDYGILFELYNCQDSDCYRDLARLRGTHYLTWRDVTKLQPVELDNSQAADRNRVGAAHAKFVNYHFNVAEFVRLVKEAVELVRTRKRTFLERHNSRWWIQNATAAFQSTHQPKTSHVEL